VTDCTLTLTHSDTCGDTTKITEAFDLQDFGGDNVRVPALGNLPISGVLGNAVCCAGPALPCFVGPAGSAAAIAAAETGCGALALPGAGTAGSVSFRQNTYVVQPNDPDPLPDQANITVKDLCDVFPAGCSSGLSTVQFTAGTDIFDDDGCTSAPKALSFPCEADGDPCTIDHCDGAGSCVFMSPGQGPECADDHYKCYKSRADFEQRSVSLVDQFGQSTATVLRPDRFCNPVDKNNEGINNPDAHLNCYRIREPSGPSRDVVVNNQFGDLRLTATKAHSLCVPAIKDQVGNLDDLGINHFKCYRVRRTPGFAAFTRRDVPLADQFEIKNTTVVRPFVLCNPVNKNGEGVPDPTNHLICYRIKDVSGQAPFVPVQPNVTDQFVVQDLQTLRRTDCRRARLLCVPSSKRIASPSGAFLDGGASSLLE
jgi:hypothetical protein